MHMQLYDSIKKKAEDHKDLAGSHRDCDMRLPTTMAHGGRS